MNIFAYQASSEPMSLTDYISADGSAVSEFAAPLYCCFYFPYGNKKCEIFSDYYCL